MGYIRKTGEPIVEKWRSYTAKAENQPKRRTAPFSYWLQGFGDFSIGAIAIYLSLPFLTSRYNHDLTNAEATLMLVSNLTIQAYFYQARNLIQEVRNRRQAEQEEKRTAANRQREEQRRLREERRVARLQEQEEKRRRKQKKVQPQKKQTTIKTNGTKLKGDRQPAKKKAAPPPAFPEEFLEPTDLIDTELEQLRKQMEDNR